jgi:hypothetical protein
MLKLTWAGMCPKCGAGALRSGDLFSSFICGYWRPKCRATMDRSFRRRLFPW